MKLDQKNIQILERLAAGTATVDSFQAFLSRTSAYNRARRLEKKGLIRRDGKLRLMCEAAPLAWVAENAGGYASSGQGPILDIVPRELHQRVPLYIGCRDTVLWIEKQLTGGDGEAGV